MMKSRIKKHLAIIGNPVDHSLSPAMHNAALKALNLPYHYGRILVLPEELEFFFKKTARKLAGFNVTIPYKEAVIPYLDYIVPKAQKMGAVNTVWNHHGKLVGLNTDGDGYLESLAQEKNFQAKGKKIVILGAGGASRGLIVALILAGAREIQILNRTLKKAKSLVQELRLNDLSNSVKIQIQSWNLAGFSKAFSEADLVINTTSIGMKGSQFEFFPWEKLPKNALISDIVYSPLWTPLLLEAKKRGYQTHSGLGMLIHQGVLAFEIWTGRKPDLEKMWKAAQKGLR